MTVPGVALDLHEGIAGNRVKSCSRWPARLSLISSLGDVVRGRCSSPNLCEYCARLAAVENAELLALDALHGVAPQTYLVLTQASVDQTPAAYRESLNQLQRALRRELAGYQAAWLVEFTTGRGDRSGGHRRPHFNGLLKGVGDDDQAQVVRDVVDAVWCRREAAVSEAQYVAPVQEMGGLMRYLALHFLKEAQAPPTGWRGHRFRTTRGYLWEPTPQARKLARASLQGKRDLWRALEQGLDATAAEEQVAWFAWVREQTTWTVGHTPNYAPEVAGAVAGGRGRAGAP